MSWRTTKSPKLKPAAYFGMNPADAEETELGEDDTVHITSPHGTAQLQPHGRVRLIW